MISHDELSGPVLAAGTGMVFERESVDDGFQKRLKPVFAICNTRIRRKIEGKGLTIGLACDELKFL